MSPVGAPSDAFWRLVLRLVYRPRRRLWRWFGLERGGVCVAVRSGDAVLLVRHSYRPRLDFPGGGLDRGEAPEACARRELREELGLEVPPAGLIPLGRLRPAEGDPRVRNHLFEWRVDRIPEVRIDRRELIWAGAVRPAAVPKADRALAVRWYLRRYAPELDQPPREGPAGGV
jgi:8-oxo-dGTP pyrophosphatase MutT (NUDIX family)